MFGASYSGDNDSTEDVYVINVDGTGLHNLTNHMGNSSYPRWSPDGTQIAFASDRNATGQIFVMDADGSNQHQVSNGPHDDRPIWSPDGQIIAFESGRVDPVGRFASLYMTSPIGPEARTIHFQNGSAVSTFGADPTAGGFSGSGGWASRGVGPTTQANRRATARRRTMRVTDEPPLAWRSRRQV